MTPTAAPNTRQPDKARARSRRTGPPQRRLRIARGSPYRLPVAVLIVVLAVTAALALVSLALYRDNENRLLKLRVRDAPRC